MYSELLEELTKAIGARALLRFNYNGENFVVEPHLVGCNRQNQDCLCGWHVATGHGTQEGWHCFLLSGIENLQIQDDRFSQKRPGYDPYDSSMNRIYYRI